MYLSFYQLATSPFQISTDPRFLWLGEKHQEALALLQYTLEENKGFALLTGDVGTGKTTVVNSLLAQTGDSVRAAVVSDPGLNRMDFFKKLAGEFGFSPSWRSKGEFLTLFTAFVHQAHDRGQRVLLVIDEAQRLQDGLLEEVRLLSNIERPEAKLVNIILVGQNEFAAILDKPANRALRQRITLMYRLEPLTAAETTAYITHRLGVAGGQAAIFSDAAVAVVARVSKGYPRLINIVCDQALLTGFVRQQHQIDAGIVTECARELAIAGSHEPAGTGGKALTALGRWVKRFKGRSAAIMTLFTVSGLILAIHSVTQSCPHPAQPPEPPSKAVSALDRQPYATLDKQPAPPPAAPGPPTAHAEPDRSDSQAPWPDKLVITFARRSDELSPEAIAGLERLAKAAQARPRLLVSVKGYTDASGSPERNQRLSQKRADMVKARLEALSVVPSRITSHGMGPAQATPGPNGAADRQSDRRVEIQLHAPGDATDPVPGPWQDAASGQQTR